MRDHIDMYKQKNGSMTVEIDLQHYLPLFLRINGQGEPLSPSEQRAFDSAMAEFTDHFAWTTK